MTKNTPESGKKIVVLGSVLPMVTKVIADNYGGSPKSFEPPKGAWSNDDVKKNILRGIR